MNFLDATLNLGNGRYKPFCKPNSNSVYVNRASNHWNTTIKQIPVGIEKRLNSISATKSDFDQTKGTYQQALNKAGYKYTLKWEESQSSHRRRVRKKEICFFNPPFSRSIKTRIGHEFINLVRKWFSSNPRLKSKFNTSTLKVSYSTCPNIGQIINSQNKKVLTGANNNQSTHKECNCTNAVFPLPGAEIGNNCRTEDVVYSAELKDNSGVEKSYIGCTSQEPVVKKILVSRIYDFLVRLRWKVMAHLKPNAFKQDKDIKNYGFRSPKFPSKVESEDLRGFEDDLWNVVKNIEFRNCPNPHMKKLHEIQSTNKTETVKYPIHAFKEHVIWPPISEIT